MAERSLPPDVLARFADAADDKRRIHDYVNEAYLFSFPDRVRLGEARAKPDAARVLGLSQSDIFDHTMLHAAADYQSDMSDLFTPTYQAWCDLEAAEILGDISKRLKADLDDALKRAQDQIFNEIARSSFYVASKPAWGDHSVTAYAVEIHHAPPGVAPYCEHVPLSELVMDRGPFGDTDGRWRQRFIQPRHLPVAYPFVADGLDGVKAFWKEALGPRHDSREPVEIMHGCRRDWDALPQEAWIYEIFTKPMDGRPGKVVYSSRAEGSGACGLIVCVADRAANSAWGVGSAALALPAARALDELRYNMMAGVARAANPAIFLSTNTEGLTFKEGVEPGRIYRFDQDYKMDVVESRRDLGEPMFAIEADQHAIRRAYFQDEPQAQAADGDIIHRKAAQYFDEKTRRSRRMDQMRHSAYREAIIPIVQRFLRIYQDRGEIAPIEIGSQIVSYRPRSPLNNAAQLEKFANGVQALQALAPLNEQIAAAIDGVPTLQAAFKLLDVDWVEMVPPEVYQQQIAAQLGAGPAGESAQLQDTLDGLSQAA